MNDNDKDTSKRVMTGGDILAYKPATERPREVRTSIPEKEMEAEYQTEELTYYSKPVILMSESLPSKVISTVDDGLTSIDSYIRTLDRKIPNDKVGDISFNDYKDAFSKGYKDTVDKFMDYHFNNINGNTDVEIYDSLLNLRKEAVEFKDTFSKVTYGNGYIESIVASDMDKVRIDKLMLLEEGENFNKINYAALNSDVQFNRISQAFATSIKSCANKLFVLSLPDTYDAIDDYKGHVSNAITKAFDNASAKSSQDRAKNNLSINTKMVTNNLINVTNGRTDLLDALHARNKLQDLPGTHSYIDTINKTVSDAEGKALSKMVDYNRSILLSSLNKDDNISSIKEKSDLRNIFCSIK